MRRMLVLVAMLALVLLALASPAVGGDNFVATLSGGQEVPARDTQAVGVATFKLREDGTALQFKVNVANIDNVVASHIHCGAVGVNGPVGVTLFGEPAGGGPVNGTLAEGTITAPDAGNACGWTDLGPTSRRCWPQWPAAPPTSTCTPTTAWRRRTPARGTSPAGRSAARSASNPTQQLEQGPDRARRRATCSQARTAGGAQRWVDRRVLEGERPPARVSTSGARRAATCRWLGRRQARVGLV